MGRSNLWSNADSLAMMVDLSWLFLCAQSFNISLEQNINKRFEQVEQQPDVDHLDVGCLGEVVTHPGQIRTNDTLISESSIKYGPATQP